MVETLTEHTNELLRWIPLLPLLAALTSGAWLVFAPTRAAARAS